MRTLNRIAVILLIVGGLNWLAVGAFDFDLIAALFGDALSRLVYIIVGVAAIYALIACDRLKRLGRRRTSKNRKPERKDQAPPK